MCLIPCGINKEYNRKGETKKQQCWHYSFLSNLNFQEKCTVANSVVFLTDSRLTWSFSLAMDQPKIFQSTPQLVSPLLKYTLLADPPKRCSTSVRYHLILNPQLKWFNLCQSSGVLLTFFQPIYYWFTFNEEISINSTVHHRGICSPFVPAGVQPPFSSSQVQQRTHGAA